MNIKLLIVAGTRPEIIKLAPLIKKADDDKAIELFFVHSGQHYNNNLYIQLIKDLELPKPKINMNIGSGSHGYQTGVMVQKIEEIIIKIDPNLVIAQGDTNTVLATALATKKLNKVFMHLEAGIRSFDNTMPEEINRRLTGICSIYHLAPTEMAAMNLLFEGENRKSIFIVGNTIVDAVLNIKNKALKKSNILDQLQIKNDMPIILITLHRPSNVDKEIKLKSIVHTLIELKDFQFIFPAHPRTLKNLKKFKLLNLLEESPNILITKPLGYLDFYKIFINSVCVLTDSGGIQEEANILRIPCLTLRNNTERPETIEYGSNKLIGMNMNKLKTELDKIISNPNYLKGKQEKNPFGDGKSSERIIEIIKELYSKNGLESNHSEIWDGIPQRKLIKVETEDPISVNEYEIKYNIRIQIIFDQNGTPKFPYDNRLIRKNDTILTIN